MSKNEFDELLLKKLQEEEVEYNPAHWDRLAQLLPPTLTPATINKSRKWAIAAGIAAAIACTLATVLYFQLSNQSADEPVRPAIVHRGNHNVSPVQPAMPQNGSNTAVNTASGLSNAGRNAQATQPAYVQQRNNIPVVPRQPVLPNNVSPVSPDNIIPQIPAPVIPEKQMPQVADNHSAPNPVPVIPEKQKENNTVHNQWVKPEEHNKTYTAYNGSLAEQTPSPFYEPPGSRKTAKTSISLGGGVNYGNLNTGYTAGVSVRRKVGSDFFVDGTVAMMYNNNASNVAVNNGPPLASGPDNSTIAARPAAFNNTNLSSPALDPIQKLYYVQFNPSVGYQLEKHVSLSVGGDFQQMLNKKEEIVQPESNNSRVFPNFDVGLTTKSEFSITPNIQAGLMYREGLNNLIKNSGTNYVNRRYIQVQFKYNIPVN